MAAPIRDPFGDKAVLTKWNWRDRRIMAFINNFTKITKADTLDDVDRQRIKKTGRLRRSLYWKTWATAGGDAQVFEASYIYYTKFVELAVGKGNPFKQLPPGIPGRKWQPIAMPDRRRKAKPSVPVEMRSQAKKFASWATRDFAYVGTMFMAYAMGNTSSAQAVINRALFWSMRKDAFDR